MRRRASSRIPHEVSSVSVEYPIGVSDFGKSRRLRSWLLALQPSPFVATPRPFNHTKGERRLYPVPECREDAGSNETCLPILQITRRDILLRLPCLPLTAGSRQ